MKNIHRLGSLAVLPLALALSACSTAPALVQSNAHTVILVHGAWMGASSWDRVAAELKRNGYKVKAVELPAHGQDNTPAAQVSFDGYVRAVAAALPEKGQATVVGHSMAGMVISALAEKEPSRIANLVYVAAYLPRSGESLYKLAMTDADSLVGKYWSQTDPKAYSPASIKAEGIPDVFCADCSPEDKKMLVETHKAEPVPPLAAAVTLSPQGFGKVPRVYVHTTMDKAVSYRLQQTMLAAAGGAQSVHTLATGHSPMLTQPLALAAIISQAAKR